MKLTHFAALLALIVLAAPAIADDADDTAHPFTEPKTAGDAHFVETFTSGMGSWIHASDDKYTGAFALTLNPHRSTKVVKLRVFSANLERLRPSGRDAFVRSYPGMIYVFLPPE